MTTALTNKMLTNTEFGMKNVNFVFSAWSRNQLSGHHQTLVLLLLDCQGELLAVDEQQESLSKSRYSNSPNNASSIFLAYSTIQQTSVLNQAMSLKSNFQNSSPASQGRVKWVCLLKGSFLITGYLQDHSPQFRPHQLTQEGLNWSPITYNHVQKYYLLGAHNVNLCVSLLLNNSFSDLPPQSKTNLCLLGIWQFLNMINF